MEFAKRIARLFHTVKYLRFKQIYYRLYYFFYQPSVYQFIHQSYHQRHWKQSWLAPGLFKATLTSSGQITFLGKTCDVINKIAWHNPQCSKLWLYNLHYFNELNTTDAEVHSVLLNQLIDRWTHDNPPMQGIAWEPYPLSLRIVNFIKWYARHQNVIGSTRLNGLGVQVEALLQQIEYHILGNHLFANGKALVFAGAYFNGERAEIFLENGLKILDQEVKEQFLSDGGHFELSPMYHAALLWDLCDLVSLANHSGLNELNERQSEWQQVIERGLIWLAAMSHPDGQSAFFNDAAFGIAPTLDELKDYAAQLGIAVSRDERSLIWLKESGYCVVNLGEGHKAILDMAKVGPDYQPGHAHADTLSFELSLYGQRVLVNSGISEYGEGALRQQQRSTRAHNTLVIDGCNSSEVWAGFRVARRAFPRNLSINDQVSDGWVIMGAHDGYLRLKGHNIHQRTWHFSKNALSIHDVIQGSYTQAEAFFYFHPDVKISELTNGVFQCDLLTGERVMMKITGAGRVFLKPSAWYPSFGTHLSSYGLVAQLNSKELLTQITW